MWNKNDVASPSTSAPAPEDRPPRPEPVEPAPSASERATIGRSIIVRGEVTGDEDLLIRGRVEGSIDLALHTVTVGNDGQVEANISGRVVTVEGEVDGDLQAEEQVVIQSSARVRGDIMAPRVVLEDGATFRGLVDMGEPAERKKASGDALPRRSEVGASAPDSSPAVSGDEQATADTIVEALP